MNVLHRFARLFLQAMSDADIEAAGKSETSIGDEDFSVRAKVHRHHPPQSERGEKARISNFLAAQRTKKRRHGIPCARGIDQDTHFDAAAGGLAEGLCECKADFVAVEDV